MALFEMTSDALVEVVPSDFASEGIWERRDLQRLVRDNIASIDDTLLVVAEEFGDFEGSDRRIDLLCVDRDGRIVVVELKRTQSGGHMELQALRYAAMVSSMTFERLVEIFERHLARTDPTQQGNALEIVAGWLDDADGENTVLSGETRIVLVSGGFGTEITGTVLWLATYGVDITCIRLVPHRVGDRLLLDITQLIPLAEAEEFTVQLRRHEQAVRASSHGRDWTQYVITNPNGESAPLRKRWAVLEMVTSLHAAGVPMTAIADALPNSRLISVPGRLTGDDLIDQFGRKYSKFRKNLRAWFTDHPLHDSETTWLLSKSWGRQTTRILDQLVEVAPNTQFDYHAVP